MRKSKIFFLFILLWFLAFYSLKAQQEKVISLNVDQSFDIRRTAEQYFGNADLWPYIVKYNNYKSLSEIKQGSALLIPLQKVKSLFEKLDLANKSIQEAALIGSKILAEELLADAEKFLKKAQYQKTEFDFDEALKSANAAIEYSAKAYRQTKEIRQKTIDAIISYKKGTVQKMFPSILKWQNAEIYENLKENDWARTLSLSMASITFQDLSQLKLNENSQAVIQTARLDQLNNKTFTKVKLEKGDAYAMLFNTPKKKFDLEIKGIKTKINSKYFWAEKTSVNSKIANYNGEIKIEAQDSAVVVAKNQGSVIPDGGLPSKPKNLLPPPKTVSPALLQIFKSPSVTFKWSEVEGAKSYWLEIALDRNFKKTFKALKDITSLTDNVEGFPGGVYYWRVCSVDNLNLPGSYSGSNSFVISLDKNKPFLFVESPGRDFSTTGNKAVIRGKTNPGCIVTSNQKEIAVENDGNFSGELPLLDGNNVIEIQTKSSAGIVNSVIRNVYSETDSVFNLTDENIGVLRGTVSITTNKDYLQLNLTTRPRSKVEITSNSVDSKRSGYADSLGRFGISLSLTGETEQFTVTVSTPAGYLKEVKLNVTKDSSPPEIVLGEPVQNYTNRSSILFAGSVNEKCTLTINGVKINSAGENKFSGLVSLKKGENSIEIKAVDAAGNSKALIKNIFFDDEPPVLLSDEIIPVDRKENIYRILVKAGDAGALRKSAEIEFQSGNSIQTEYLELKQANNVYEGVFQFTYRDKPVIKKITLEDYLSNKKSYEIN